jgi:hypothetical protein
MMKTRALLLSLLTLGLVSAAAAGPLGTTFTYQGILADAGSPVSGVVDFRFALWDAASGGVQVGSAVAIEDIVVTGGRVTVPLDFGAVFNGNELWLAVEVRDGVSTGAYTLLDPRQALTAAPFAAHALEAQTAGSAATAAHASTADSATTAGHATTADSAATAVSATTASEADTLDGEHGAFYRSWFNLTGKPAGLDDGDDDTIADLSCSSGEVAAWNGSMWACASVGGSPYSRTVVVGPVGDAAANGAALVAVASGLSVPAGPADAVLIVVEPGEYDLGGANFGLWQWVHLRGAGRLATRIYSEACGPVDRVVAFNDGEISDLTIENTCADPSSAAHGVTTGSIGTASRISRVNIVLSGSTSHSYGIYNGTDNMFIEDVWITVTGTDFAVGIESYADNVFLIDTVADVNGTSVSRAVYLYGDGQTMISRGSYSGAGASQAFGLRTSGASVDASDVNIAGGTAAVSMYGTDGQQFGFFSRCEAHGSVLVNGDGVDDMAVIIRQSRISDPTNTISLMPGTGTVRVTGTELAGGPVSGAVQCVAVWDEGTGFYPNTCP